MAGIPLPISGPGTGVSSDDGFETYDSFLPAEVPEPGPFVQCQEIFAGTEHAAFHRLSKRLFDDRGVYDVTFGYNLARLNLDPRHPGSGYRCAVESVTEDSDGEDDGARVHRAEFTPTTPFCPRASR